MPKDSGKDKRFHTFFKGISLKVNVRARLKLVGWLDFMAYQPL